MTRRTVVGCMTGTSCDGLDVAVVCLDGRGLEVRASLVRAHSVGLGEVGQRLRRFARGEPATALEIARMARDLGVVHVYAIAEALRGTRASFVALHGQTVLHAPPLTWQLIEPEVVSRGVGLPVVFGLRGADAAAGGQGAPITPIADWVMLRDGQETRAVVNLGGFCNATILPAGGDPAAVRGFDVCACNQVMDGAARALLGTPIDRDGVTAMAGEPDDALTDALAAHLAAQAAAARSMGSHDEPESGGAGWFDAWLARAREVPPAVALRSAALAVARTIAARVREEGPSRVILAGGGLRNAALRGHLDEHLGGCGTTDGSGVPAPMREAMGIAVLGALCADGVPITLPGVTGCGHPAPVAGRWTGLDQRLAGRFDGDHAP